MFYLVIFFLGVSINWWTSIPKQSFEWKEDDVCWLGWLGRGTKIAEELCRSGQKSLCLDPGFIVILGRSPNLLSSPGAPALVPCHASLLPGGFFSSPYLESSSLSPMSCYCLLKPRSLLSDHFLRKPFLTSLSRSGPSLHTQHHVPALPSITTVAFVYLFVWQLGLSLLHCKPWDLRCKKVDQFVFPIVVQPQTPCLAHSSCMNEVTYTNSSKGRVGMPKLAAFLPVGF